MALLCAVMPEGGGGSARWGLRGGTAERHGSVVFSDGCLGEETAGAALGKVSADCTAE